MRIAFPLAIAALSLTAPAGAAPRDPLIARVETQLGTAVEIAGTRTPKRTLAGEMAAKHVPGVSIAVIHGGRIAWAKGYGVVDAKGAAVTPQTRFQAGSISKSVTTLAILRLVAEGKVSLDRPVNSYLTSWKLPDSDKGAADAVTLRKLLSHTGGINVHGFAGYAKDGPVPSLPAILDGRPPANTPAIRITGQPGAAWSYSGGGYVIAQQLAEDVTGKRFADWAARAWLTPSGMTNSSFDPSDAVPHALGHAADGSTVPGGYHLYPEAAPAGLWTTPSDLAHGMLALSRSLAGGPGAVLPRSVAATVTVPVKTGETVGFDTGVGRSGRWLAKGGDTEGFAALMVFYPGKGDGAVVMTNGTQGTALADAVMRSIASAYGWPDFGPRVRRAVAIAPALLAALPGTYRYRDTGSFTITRNGDALTIVSPGETPERLYADPSGEFFTLSQDVAFVFDPGSAVGHIQINNTAIAFRRESK